MALVISAVAAIATIGAAGTAGAGVDEFDAPQTTRLPPPLTHFTGQDALAAIFPSYRIGHSAIREIPSDDAGSTHVGFAEAKPWRANGGNFVIVRFEIGTFRKYGIKLCFPCLEEDGLAVLDERAGRMHVVAQAYGNNDTAPIIQAGIDDVWLDLAPYRFDARETLIGVRQIHTSGPGAELEEMLSLFRVIGSRLVTVGRLPLSAARVRPEDDSLDREEAVVIVSARPGGGPNDLLVRSKITRCAFARRAAGFACDPAHRPVLIRDWTSECYRYAKGNYNRIGRTVTHLAASSSSPIYGTWRARGAVTDPMVHHQGRQRSKVG